MVKSQRGELTQAEFDDRIGIGQSQVSRWEKGDRTRWRSIGSTWAITATAPKPTDWGSYPVNSIAAI